MFREMNLWEKLAIRLFPARRRKYEKDLREAIEYLVNHPEAPCAVEGTLIEGTVMPHCQLCFQESPQHAPFCPVGTGVAVLGHQGFVCAVCGGRNGMHYLGWAGTGSCPGARYETPQAFDIQALQAQIIELRERVRLLELKLK